MSKIVRELLTVHGYDPQEIAAEIGATKEEIDLLQQEGVFSAKRIDKHVFSRAWYPERNKWEGRRRIGRLIAILIALTNAMGYAQHVMR